MTSQSSGVVVIFPVAVGIGVILTSIIVYHVYSSKLKGKCCQSKKETQNKTLVLLEDPQIKYSIPLIEVEKISHDTRRFRFELPTKNHVLGLPIGQHIHISAKIEDDLVVRSYTPVSSDDDQGYMDLVIKVYFRNVHPRFPDGGKMSQHLESLKVGDKVQVRGPSGRLRYQGAGTFSIRKLRKDPSQTVTVTHVSMIAGGTGITPMLQLIRHICKDPTDTTKVRLIFANQTEKDILLRDELETAQKENPDRFELWYTLDTPPDNWQYSSGFINDVMIQEHLFSSSNNNLVLMCGPPPMINFACIPNLEKLGFDKEFWFAY